MVYDIWFSEAMNMWVVEGYKKGRVVTTPAYFETQTEAWYHAGLPDMTRKEARRYRRRANKVASKAAVEIW